MAAIDKISSLFTRNVLLNVSTDKFGCRILQRFMDRCSKATAEAIRDEFVEILTKHTRTICFDQFANCNLTFF